MKRQSEEGQDKWMTGWGKPGRDGDYDEEVGEAGEGERH